MYFLVKVSTLASLRHNTIAPLIDYSVNIHFIWTGKPNKLHDLIYSNIHSMVVNESYSVMSSSLWSHGLYSPWNSPGQNTGVGNLSLLQGIFPTQRSNPGLLYCRWILYQLSHKGSPRILEWVAYPFSSGSSEPRNQTGVSCIAGGFFTRWATREAWSSSIESLKRL